MAFRENKVRQKSLPWVPQLFIYWGACAGSCGTAFANDIHISALATSSFGRLSVLLTTALSAASPKKCIQPKEVFS